MFTISHDYYGILGVSKEATDEEIRSQYRKLMKEHHPDQYKGLRAKYVELGDEDLLKVFDEKIRQAEEMSKLINEAFEALIDPIKRRQYDDQIYEPAVAKPEIAIHPTKLTFGTLTEGQRKVLFFTVENKGGPVTSVNVDWENTKPDWGELVIEPDPEATFPINVTVKVDTTGIPSGPKYEKVQVTVDGEVHLVEVYLAVEAAQKATAPSTGTPVSMPTSPALKIGGAAPKSALGVVGLGCLGLLLLVMIGSAVASSTEQARREAQETSTQVARETVIARAQQALPLCVSLSDVKRARDTQIGFTTWAWVYFTVTNKCTNHVRYDTTNSYGRLWSYTQWGSEELWGYLEPGESETRSAEEGGVYWNEDTRRFEPKSWFEGEVLEELCVKFVHTLEFEAEVGHRICLPIVDSPSAGE